MIENTKKEYEELKKINEKELNKKNEEFKELNDKYINIQKSLDEKDIELNKGLELNKNLNKEKDKLANEKNSMQEELKELRKLKGNK